MTKRAPQSTVLWQTWVQFLMKAGSQKANHELLADYFFTNTLISPDNLSLFLRSLERHIHSLSVPAVKQNAATAYLETISPLCERFGLFELKNHMDDVCFKIVDPKSHAQVNRALHRYQRTSEESVQNAVKILSELLRQAGYAADIQGRYKNAYSIYRKLKRKSRGDALSLHDIFAFRVILQSDQSQECFDVINLLHDHFHPIAGSFKDYVSIPKINGYQSVHTILNGVVPGLNLPIEVQIRTKTMHDVAEHGFASHWLYARSKRTKLLTDKEERLVQHFQGLSKSALREKSVYCFTPTGDLLKLDNGSTVADFAHRIHSELRKRATGALVNGRKKGMRYRLRDGDSILVLSPQSR